MNRTTLFILALLLAANLAYAQKISNIDFDAIQKEISDTGSSLYYPKLIERFKAGDSTLGLRELECIYYGHAFSENYNPYGESDNEKEFTKLYNEGNYGSALPFGIKEVQENPVNLKVTFRVAVCHNELGDKSLMRQYAKRYYSLLDAIYGSGDGLSMETAYVVLNVADEYQVLADKELQMTKQALVGDTDVMTLDAKSQEGKDKIDKLYFNVSKPLDSLTKMFEE